MLVHNILFDPNIEAKVASNAISGGYKTLIITMLCIVVLSTFGVSCLMKPWMAVSVPLFYLGMFAAEQTKKQFVFTSLIIMGVSLIVALFDSYGLVLHVLINYVITMALIVIAFHNKIAIKGLPYDVSGTSLDIYLTHNKVRVILYGLQQFPSVISYILGMTGASVIFGLIIRRCKLG